MDNFIPPTKGTKLGEFEATWLKRLYYNLEGVIAVAITVVLPIAIGFRLMKDPFNPEWASWIVAIILCLIGVLFAIFIIGVIEFISEKKLSLFLVDNGVEINEYFIPFKNTDYSSNNYDILRDGIVYFKLDGEYLLIKTEGLPYFFYYSPYLDENKIKFKIESKYHFCKEELLAYLNNIIPQN